MNNFTHYLHMLRFQTHRKPFPQPRGPKKSSVGRQTFLHTPLRLGQDQGKDAASFSTTVKTSHLCLMSRLLFRGNMQTWRLTVEQQDDQECQNNHTVTSHRFVSMLSLQNENQARLCLYFGPRGGVKIIWSSKLLPGFYMMELQAS